VGWRGKIETEKARGALQNCPRGIWGHCNYEDVLAGNGDQDRDAPAEKSDPGGFADPTQSCMKQTARQPRPILTDDQPNCPTHPKIALWSAP
jgi:hypothetical protein